MLEFLTLCETPGFRDCGLVAILNITPTSILKSFLQSNISYAAWVRGVAVSDKMLGKMTI